MHQAALDYLEQHPLKNITGLKMLFTYPEACTVFARSDGVLIVLRPDAMPYDRETYPDAQQIVLLYSDSKPTTTALLESVPVLSPTIWKIVSGQVQHQVAAHFALSRLRAFVSFTDAQPYVSDVSITTTPSQTAFERYATLGHEPNWLLALLKKQQAFCCELPQSVCFAFANHQNIWEVGGVHTVPEARGQGLAARVVRSSIAELQRRGLRTRYQVAETNLASIALAKRLGLEQVCTITHWRS
jgi:RimJ/RimL family protein N-acetyltransferase